VCTRDFFVTVTPAFALWADADVAEAMKSMMIKTLVMIRFIEFVE
jgi:hypothetical protein